MESTNGSGYQLIEDCEATNRTLYKFYAAVMIVIFILALPLNASVLHLFIFKLKFWKSNTNNVFLFNLVLADVLLLFCLPIKAYNFIRGERRSANDTVCKAMLFMLFLNRGASIAFLTVTSIDRYFNVVHPGRKNLLRALKKSPHISIFIWLLLLPLTIPTMLKNFDCCNSHSPQPDDTLVKVRFFQSEGATRSIFVTSPDPVFSLSSGEVSRHRREEKELQSAKPFGFTMKISCLGAFDVMCS